MKVLVIGASSYIGARVYYDLTSKFELIGTYYNHSLSDKFIHLDINDHSAVEQVVTDTNPDVIIHLANYSSSRTIAGNEDKYQQLNFDATQIIINIANKTNTKVIFLSSMAAATKANLYGQLKAKSEDLIKTVKSGYFILRPSAVIGVSPNRQNNKITDKIVATINGNEHVFDTSWLLQPTYIGHISQVIEQVLLGGHCNNELSLYTNHPVTQYQIAQDILINFGKSAGKTDLGIKLPLMPDNYVEMEQFNLTLTTYPQIIKSIVKEIHTLEQFKL